MNEQSLPKIVYNRVLLLRHGQTEFNLSGRIQGVSDVPLTELGRQQAHAAADLLAKINIGRVLASPLSRAYETAKIVADKHGLPVETDERLMERAYGQWEGLTMAEVKDRYPQAQEVWAKGGNPAGMGVETWQATGERMHAAIVEAISFTGMDNRAITRPEENSNASGEKTLLVVAHGGSIAALTSKLLAPELERRLCIGSLENCHWAKFRVLPAPDDFQREAKDRQFEGQLFSYKWVLDGWNLGADAI